VLADLRRAVSLLTVLPVGAPALDVGASDVQADDTSSSRPGRAMAFYPLVGAVIGGVLAGAAALLHWSGLTTHIPLLAAAIVVAVWVGLTGGLHLDGWADCCDALFVPANRERRLAIMKDPHLGGFGVIGLVLLLLAKVAAVQGILLGARPLLVLLAVPAVARWAVVVAARAFPSARPGGMGDFFRQGLGWWPLAVATLFALAAAVPLLWRGVVVWAVVIVVLLLLALLARSRLGGLTGDVYGAVIELGETVVLVALCFL
jgi:adenosylcobinamide-GDP ribazoletransferase